MGIPLAKTHSIPVIQRSMVFNGIILMAINGKMCQGCYGCMLTNIVVKGKAP